MLKVVQCYTAGGDGIRKLCENGVGGSGGGSLMQKLVYEKMEVWGHFQNRMENGRGCYIPFPRISYVWGRAGNICVRNVPLC